MAVGEDDFTGDLALAFGSEDCTVSVWAISKLAATQHARMNQDESLEACFPASHATAALSSRRQVRRHDLSSKHSSAVVSIRFASALTLVPVPSLT
jgi:hypothetical protein